MRRLLLCLSDTRRVTDTWIIARARFADDTFLVNFARKRQIPHEFRSCCVLGRVLLHNEKKGCESPNINGTISAFDG